MTAGELFQKLERVGGLLMPGWDGEIAKVAGPDDLLKELELMSEQDYGNLRAIMQEQYPTGPAFAVRHAEQILRQARPVTPTAQKEQPRKKPCACAHCVLAALTAYRKGDTCTPSLAMLVRDLKLQSAELPKVRAALASLEATGVITITRRPNTSNRYTILTPIEGANAQRVTHATL